MTMRVVHVPFGYYPDPVGGTEVYVAGLATALRRHAVESAVAAPASGADDRVYAYDETVVHRFAVGPPRDVSELYGDGDAAAAAAIGRVLDEHHADVLHLHAFTSAASLRAVRAAHERGVAVAFTYHTPTASCVRGTLLRDGRGPCDGQLLEQRCASCLLEGRGAGDTVRAVLSRLPVSVGSTVAGTGATGPWVTALRARELTRLRHDAFRQLLQEADAAVAVCDWVRLLLIHAGAPPSRLFLSRQGIGAQHGRVVPRQPSDTLRLVFIGRLHQSKGIHVAVQAITSMRTLPATLDIFGVAQDADAVRYEAALRSLAASDPRIRFRPPVPSADVVSALSAYDATVVPSQWLETGPLTVLESFAAGVPVVGSNLGGIAELVEHGRDGWLVTHNDVGAWKSAIDRLVTDRGLLARLAAGVRPPRSMDDVATEMASVYATIARHRDRARQVDAARQTDGIVSAGVV